MDLFLSPLDDLYSEMHTGFIIELKYLKRRKSLKDGELQEATEAARSQVQGYLQEDRFVGTGSVNYVGIVLVFHGWETVVCEDVKGSTQ